MASPNLYNTGVGGTAGAQLATVSPLLMTGFTWYVHSATGEDAASPRGRERIRPLATLAQAHTNASAGDIICCLSGHAETLTAVQTFNKNGLLLIGEGSGVVRPRFTRNANAVLFNLTGTGIRLQNLFFPASVTTASALSRVVLVGDGCRVEDCYFEASTLDDGASIESASVGGVGNHIIRNTTIISTATLPSDQPLTAITVTNALSQMELDTVVMDGGSSGWASPFAMTTANAVTDLWGINVDLLNDSDISIATGSRGFIHVRNKSGSARITWAA